MASSLGTAATLLVAAGGIYASYLTQVNLHPVGHTVIMLVKDG